MRIVAGEAGGVTLAPVPRGVRPTSDRVREALFNMLGQFFDGGDVLDLYAGTGALGIEALSRGADRAVFVEKNGRAVATIDENLKRAGLRHRARVIRGDAGKEPGRLSGEFELIFIDPPYRIARSELAGVIERLPPLLVPEGRVVVESDTEIEGGQGLHKWASRVYGQTVITIFNRGEVGHEGGDMPG